MASLGSQAERVICVEVVFDTAAAERVKALVSAIDAGSELYVDLTRVRAFEDRAMAVLGNALAEARGPVSVRGLGRHQLRMLRYLGVPRAALDCFARDAGEPSTSDA